MPKKIVDRFQDAKTLEELTKMLDDFWMRNPEMIAGKSPPPYRLTARAQENMRLGMLIQATSGRSVRRADSKKLRAATGIITKILAPDFVEWTPMVFDLFSPIGAGKPGLSELWLATDGQMTFNKANDRGTLLQRIGIKVEYDAQNDLHLCFINPLADMGISIL